MAGTIPFKETLTIEFKSDIKKCGDADFFEDIVAFANTVGEDLYLGVEDDGTITGVHKDHLLHVSDSKAYPLLKELVRQDILLPINKGRYAKYKLKI